MKVTATPSGALTTPSRLLSVRSCRAILRGRTDRRAQRHLARADGGTSQQQVGHVRARDKQDECHRAKCRQRHESHLVRHVILDEGASDRGPAVVVRIGIGQPPSDSVNLVVRLLPTDARPEQSEHLQVPRSVRRAAWATGASGTHAT